MISQQFYSNLIMSVNKINPVYTTKTKQSGDPLTHNEWNDISSAVNEVQVKVNDIIENGVGSGEGSGTPSNTSEILTVNNKHNVTLGGNSIKNVNIEPGYPNTDTSKYGDIALKPGDDIQFASHHREPKKRDKIVVKNIDGSDNPVKLQVVAGEMELAVGTANNPKTATKKKDKTTGNDTENAMFKASDAKTLDIKILTGNTLDSGLETERDERAYLKVRAQAIDLRCEKHGGIALQPKGYDGDGNMNKIKFEHGGGDGLEFGTFNTEKTSLYTDEYRFKKKGVWKMATRTTEASGKDIIDENTPVGKTATGALKYVKQADDFYDIISNDDVQCTTEDIIKTAHTFNGGKNRHVKVTSKGNIEIATNITYSLGIEETPQDPSGVISISTISTKIAALDEVVGGDIFNDSDFEISPTEGVIYSNGTQYFSFFVEEAPNINIESGGALKLKGILDFGSTFGFGETDNGIQYFKKLTKKAATKNCDKLQIIATNNHTTNNFITNKVVYDDSVSPATFSESQVTIAPGNSEVVAEAYLYDIIKLTLYMKANELGPWTPQL